MTPAKPTPPDLTIAQVAAQLQVSTISVHRWRKAGKFPGSYKIGGVVRIPQSDVDRVRSPV